MRKNVSVKGFLILCVIFFASCSSQDDLVYSCDPIINDWVKDNIQEIKTFEREQLLELSSDYMRAAYITLEPIQAQLFWIQKFDEMLNLVFWNEKEHDHLQNMQDFISSNAMFFDKNNKTDTIRDQFEIFIYRWKEYGREELNWTDQTMYFMLAQGDRFTYDNYQGVENISKETPMIKSSSEFTPSLKCNCHFGGLTSPAKYCNPSYWCAEAGWGCGDFFASPCDGLWENRI